MPAVDGSACVFHLSGQFDSVTASGAWLDITNRSEREAKTMEWLGISPAGGATWWNGWLEDPTTGMKWYADMSSSVNAPNRVFAPGRYFNLLTGGEVDCMRSHTQCHSTAVTEWWGTKFSNTDQPLWVNSIAISNGSRYGVFLYEAFQASTARSRYDLATWISNTSVVILLLRWLAESFAHFNAYRHGHSRGRAVFFTGIGCLSCSRGFESLPAILLPRLAAALAGFFTAGCQFKGEQRSFGEAWFAIYPALAEVMLFYYNVLNFVAKVLNRRMSDALFGPSLLTLCLLHRLRRTLANGGLYEFDGRMATVMTSHEYEKLRLVDLFTTDAAFRLYGKVRSIFAFKLAVLAANLLPLLFSTSVRKQPWASARTGDSSSSSSTESKTRVPVTTAIERSLGVRASESGGLGLSSMYLHGINEPHRYMNAYELVRLGYVVLGDTFVIPLKDWLVFVLLAVVGIRRQPFGLRVMAFRIFSSEEPAAHASIRCVVNAEKLQLYQHHDQQLLAVSVWDISAMPLP